MEIVQRGDQALLFSSEDDATTLAGQRPGEIYLTCTRQGIEIGRSLTTPEMIRLLLLLGPSRKATHQLSQAILGCITIPCRDRVIALQAAGAGRPPEQLGQEPSMAISSESQVDLGMATMARAHALEHGPTSAMA